MMTNDKINELIELSKMIIGNEITHKLDKIATIYINGDYYFTVFRRYNSPYNIVIMDKNDDIYLHQDHTIRKSLKAVMCLPDCESDKMYTSSVTSYKHSGPVPNMFCDIADMRWTTVQDHYEGVIVNFEGMFNNSSLSTPQKDPNIVPIMPDAPTKIPMNDTKAATILMSLSVPVNENPWILRECDGPTLSMRFEEVRNRINNSQMDEDSDSENSDSEDSDSEDSDSEDSEYVDDESKYDSEYEEDENNYTVLRSGTLIPKTYMK